MAGIITSRFHDNDTRTALPGASRYSAIEDIIDGWTSGRSKPEGMSADEFAAHIADDIVGGRGAGGLVWKGPNAGAVKMATRWFPRTLLVSFALLPTPRNFSCDAHLHSTDGQLYRTRP